MTNRNFTAIPALALASIVALYVQAWLFSSPDLPPPVQFSGAAAIAGYLLLIAAATGIASMATVQFWKYLFFPRAAFHARELRAFLGGGSGSDGFGGDLMPFLGLAGTEQEHEKYDPRVRSVLDAPTEVLMGQLRSAADYIMLRPEGFHGTLRDLGGPAGQQAIDEYLRDLSDLRRTAPTSNEDIPELAPDSLVAVRFFVEQHLNLIHLTLRDRWRRLVRTLAMVVAGATGVLTFHFSDLRPAAMTIAIFASIVWGGFFSWFARDLVALIERRRD